MDFLYGFQDSLCFLCTTIWNSTCRDFHVANNTFGNPSQKIVKFPFWCWRKLEEYWESSAKQQLFFYAKHDEIQNLLCNICFCFCLSVWTILMNEMLLVFMLASRTLTLNRLFHLKSDYAYHKSYQRVLKLYRLIFISLLCWHEIKLAPVTETETVNNLNDCLTLLRICIFVSYKNWNVQAWMLGGACHVASQAGTVHSF